MQALTQEQIFQLMDEAADLSKDELLRFCLSGGEPFLDFDLLLSVIAYGHALGGEVTCVTNGYWATSAERARDMLSKAKAAGLTHLAVSRSRFHEQFVKLKRVERVLEAAHTLQLSCAVKYARLKSDTLSNDELQIWATSLGVEKVEDFPVLPYLRESGHVADEDYIREEALPDGPCPGAIITVVESGNALMCCAPGRNDDFLSVGRLGEVPLKRMQQRFYMGGKQQILRKHGPIHFAKEAQKRGLGHRLHSHYANACDLCAHIRNDPELAAVANEMSRDQEIEQVRQLIEPLVTAKEPVAA